MASSYSSDLKLELQATGENASTWGDKTNNNLNLIQQAIAGYESIDVASSDVALLILNETPPESYNVHYAGWDVSGNTPNIPVGIHHPSGDIKKISFDYDNASNSGNFWDIDSWDDGTTEPGSSGSPLFDGISHRIIGQLYGGVASCTNFGYDTYGKTSVSWNNGLSTYLDPNNSGLQILDGTSTGGGLTILHDDLDDMPELE